MSKLFYRFMVLLCATGVAANAGLAIYHLTVGDDDGAAALFAVAGLVWVMALNWAVRNERVARRQSRSRRAGRGVPGPLP
jgi:hypothetical protein